MRFVSASHPHQPASCHSRTRQLKLENRKAKTPVTRSDLQQAWQATAARFDYTAAQPVQASGVRTGAVPEQPREDRVEQRFTERAATFEPGELRAALLEQSVGELSPRQALDRAKDMIAERRILPLRGGLMTTLTVRAREQAIERRFSTLATPAGRDVGDHARTLAGDQVAERIGGLLSDEQAHALAVITGPERAAILVGPAGTGKGVVIDATARAQQFCGHQTLGIAVSGSTAQRLGQDSPALAGHTLTLDALVSRIDRGRLAVGPNARHRGVASAPWAVGGALGEEIAAWPDIRRRDTALYPLRCDVGDLGLHSHIRRGWGAMEGSRFSVASSFRGRSFPHEAV